eukprot:7283976-Prymnesium_polylepis.2
MGDGGSAMRGSDIDGSVRPRRFACLSPEYMIDIPATLHVVASARALVSHSPATTLSRTYVKRAVHAAPSHCTTTMVYKQIVSRSFRKHEAVDLAKARAVLQRPAVRSGDCHLDTDFTVNTTAASSAAAASTLTPTTRVSATAAATIIPFTFIASSVAASSVAPIATPSFATLAFSINAAATLTVSICAAISHRGRAQRTLRQRTSEQVTYEAGVFLRGIQDD